MSMQSTICSLSIKLETTQKELDEYKKYSYDLNTPPSEGTIINKFDMHDSMS